MAISGNLSTRPRTLRRWYDDAAHRLEQQQELHYCVMMGTNNRVFWNDRRKEQRTDAQ
jgi:hypothetical protein